MLRRILREPLLHFLAAGGALFLVFNLIGEPREAATDETTITVDREALLTFLQYRSKAFARDHFSDKLDNMSRAERRDLVDQYVREEVLYREAKAMNLGRSDYVMRRRLVQKMEFVLEDLAESRAEPEEDELRAYLEKHRDRYVVAPSWTFTHVFFSTDKHGANAARQKAKALLPELKTAEIGFNRAAKYGDRFPFLHNYVERTPDFVASHFGDRFMTRLREHGPAEGQWRGPLRSDYGYHLVLVTRHAPERLPDLAEIRGRVAQDFRRARMREARRQAIAEMREEYDIRVGAGLEAGS